MKSILAGLLLFLSALAFSGTSAAMSEEPPSAHQLQFQPSLTPAQNAVQVEDIHDIKGPVPLSNLSRFLIPVGATLFLLIMAMLLFFFLKRRRRPKAVVSPPDSIALAELDRTRMMMEQPLAYAERISAILRQYIEARFQIPSTRQTTWEFFSRLQNGTTIAEVDIHNHTGNLQECMEQCDMAKYAHSTPDFNDMIRMDKAVRTFIETTRQKHEPTA